MVQNLLEIHARKLRLLVPALSRDALEALVTYDFPGIVRELEHLLLRILVLREPGATVEHADVIEGMGERWRTDSRPDCVVPSLDPAQGLATAVARYEQALFVCVF